MSLSDSDLSSLSSAPPSDEEPNPMALDEPVGITKYFQKKQSETPPPKRAPSPPHEYVLADNPDIAVSYISLIILHGFKIACMTRCARSWWMCLLIVAIL